MTPISGPLFGNLVFLVLGFALPMTPIVVVMWILLGGGISALITDVVGLLIFCLIVRSTLVVMADKSGVL